MDLPTSASGYMSHYSVPWSNMEKTSPGASKDGRQSSFEATKSKAHHSTNLLYKRVSVACVPCRRREVRCIASADPRGQCSNCARLHEDCARPDPRKRRRSATSIKYSPESKGHFDFSQPISNANSTSVDACKAGELTASWPPCVPQEPLVARPSFWPYAASDGESSLGDHHMVARPAALPQLPDDPSPSAPSQTCDSSKDALRLVDLPTQIVHTVWPPSSVVLPRTRPLRQFIEDILRWSRTTNSTLRLALYYLILIKPHITKHDFGMKQPAGPFANIPLRCGYRMFLAALILAFKVLQDKCYSVHAWSEISSINTIEITQSERYFLLAVDWKLHITEGLFQRWGSIIDKCTSPSTLPSPGALCQQTIDQQMLEWKHIIMRLTPELDDIGAPLS